MLRPATMAASAISSAWRASIPASKWKSDAVSGKGLGRASFSPDLASGLEYAGVDIFRLDDAQEIVGHWDLLQEAPEVSARLDGMF